MTTLVTSVQICSKKCSVESQTWEVSACQGKLDHQFALRNTLFGPELGKLVSQVCAMGSCKLLCKNTSIGTVMYHDKLCQLLWWLWYKFAPRNSVIDTRYTFY